MSYEQYLDTKDDLGSCDERVSLSTSSLLNHESPRSTGELLQLCRLHMITYCRLHMITYDNEIYHNDLLLHVNRVSYA